MVASDGTDWEKPKNSSVHTVSLQLKFEARAYWIHSRSTTNSNQTFGHTNAQTHRRLVSH